MRESEYPSSALISCPPRPWATSWAKRRCLGDSSSPTTSESCGPGPSVSSVHDSAGPGAPSSKIGVMASGLSGFTQIRVTPLETRGKSHLDLSLVSKIECATPTDIGTNTSSISNQCGVGEGSCNADTPPYHGRTDDALGLGFASLGADRIRWCMRCAIANPA